MSQITKALQCVEFYFLHHTIRTILLFSVCIQSPPNLYTTSHDIAFALSSNEGNSYRKEIKVTLDQNALEELWRQSDMRPALPPSSLPLVNLNSGPEMT